MTDRLQKFLFEHAAARGEFIDLATTWQHIQKNHTYPPAVLYLLGEMTAAAVLLAGNIKFNGSLIMQIQGDGPVTLLVAECNSNLQVRATAKLAENAVIPNEATLHQLVNANGRGRFVITIDIHDKLPGQLPYQGIIPFEGESIAKVIENYMRQSEQLDTRLWLAANDVVSRGFLLQKLPGETGKDGLSQDSEETANAWDDLVALSSTLKKDEILKTDMDTLRHRLFHEKDIRLFDPRYPTFFCPCSRKKIADMFRLLGQAEIHEALESQSGHLPVNCDFCGKTYHFDKTDIDQIFAENPA